MLRSEEYATIKTDSDRVSRVHFSKSLLFREDMSSARSEAPFPPAELAAVIGQDYEEECRMLCYGPYPCWAELQARFLELRTLL